MTTTMTLEAGFMVTRMVLGQWLRDNGTVRGFFLFSHPVQVREYRSTLKLLWTSTSLEEQRYGNKNDLGWTH